MAQVRMSDANYFETLGGSWWCLVCRAPASIEDPGESNPVCGNCGKRRCEFRSSAGRATLVLLKAPEPVFVPDEARPVENKKRLPSAERPSLSEMTFKGYWRCLACEEPTRRDEQECCVLCGSSQVEFQLPTLPNES